MTSEPVRCSPIFREPFWVPQPCRVFSLLHSESLGHQQRHVTGDSLSLPGSRKHFHRVTRMPGSRPRTNIDSGEQAGLARGGELTSLFSDCGRTLGRAPTADSL